MKKYLTTLALSASFCTAVHAAPSSAAKEYCNALADIGGVIMKLRQDDLPKEAVLILLEHKGGEHAKHLTSLTELAYTLDPAYLTKQEQGAAITRFKGLTHRSCKNAIAQ